MSGYDEQELPSRYGAAYLGRAKRLATGDTAAKIRALQAGGLLTGAPLEILVAFIAPGFLSANTTDATRGPGMQVAFHEIGLWQIPAGPADRDPATKRPRAPAPNPDPRAPHNAWGRLATDADVKRALGRAASMAPGAWKTAERDQHAIGLAMLRDDYRAAVARLDPSIRPTGWHTPWGVAVMMTSFSAGQAGADDLIDRYAARLAPFDETRRFGALINAVCVDVQAGKQSLGTPDRHSDREHRLLRTWQKIDFARRIANATGTDPTPFDVGLGDARPTHERIVLRANWNLPPLPGDTVAALVP